MRPAGAQAVRSTCIRCRYVGYRHTQTTGAADTPYRHFAGALHVQPTHAPAACERRALDGIAASCEAMKRDGVKRLRQRSGHTRSEAKAEGGVIAFCALSDASAIAMARGLRG